MKDILLIAAGVIIGGIVAGFLSGYFGYFLGYTTCEKDYDLNNGTAK